jgi:hypothetical protein
LVAVVAVLNVTAAVAVPPSLREATAEVAAVVDGVAVDVPLRVAVVVAAAVTVAETSPESVDGVGSNAFPMNMFCVPDADVMFVAPVAPVLTNL